MRIVRGLRARLRSMHRLRRPSCLAVGVFDGVHKGHLSIISEALRRAGKSGSVPAVLTFDPHPDAVISAEGAPPLLTTTDEKLALFRSLGVRLAVVAPFDRALARIPAKVFVREVLVGKLRVRCLVVGEGWRFGRGGEGTPALLREMAPQLGFSVGVVQSAVARRAKISSTRIRRLLLRGQVSAAQELLGRRYQVAGEVVRGSGLGRKLGWPTANIEVPSGKLLPADGVYACLAGLRKRRPAMAYIGRRPTVAREGERRLEVHFGDAGRRLDLLGRVLRVEFAARLRGDRKFLSTAALTAQAALAAQMARDWVRARKVLASLHA